MPRKKPTNTSDKTEDAAEINSVSVTIKREHCITGHSVELRKNDDGLVIEARTEDWRHIYTVGAKLVEEIFSEVGYKIPATDTEELEIIFSPYTSEVVAIQPKAKVAPVVIVEKVKTVEISDETDSTNDESENKTE